MFEETGRQGVQGVQDVCIVGLEGVFRTIVLRSALPLCSAKNSLNSLNSKASEACES